MMYEETTKSTLLKGNEWLNRALYLRLPQRAYHGENHMILCRENITRDSSVASKACVRQALHKDSVAQVEEDEDPIIFTLEDQEVVLVPHDDPMVISTIITLTSY